MEALNKLNEMLNKNDEKASKMLRAFSNIHNSLKENVSMTMEHISNNKELDLTFLQNQLHKLKNLKLDSKSDDKNEDDISTTSTQTNNNESPKTSETNSKENEPPSVDVQSNKTTTRSSRSRAVVKKEKMSVAPLQMISENIKTEREEMLPPAVPQKKVNKKKEPKIVVKTEPKTRLRSTIAKKSQDSDRSSDVIIEAPSIETLNISDDGPIPEVPKIRVTRSKALKKAPAKTKKRNSSASPEVDIKPQAKRAKHHSVAKDKSVYEDAICSTSTVALKEQMAKQEKHTVVLLKPLSKESIRVSKQVENCNDTCTVSSDTNRSIINETIDIPPEPVPDANATYVKPADQREETVHNETYKVAENNATFVKQTDNEKEIPSKFMDDLLTDDESEEEKVTTLPPKKAVSKKGTKAIFDYENSPIKKRVEAFEKLATQVSEIPVRQTRTRTNEATWNKGKTTPLSANKYSSSTNRKPSTVTTPVNTRNFVPATLATTKILCRDQTSPLIHTKPLSALKTSTQEYREKQKAQEREAIRKKEALMRSQSEEKRKKREEKEQKVKQAKEAQEREKQQMMEMQKLKEEKHRQLLIEKQEKLQQQKEEAEKKRMHAKLLSQKKKEEERKRLEEQKLETLEAMKQCKTPTMPIYKSHPLPKLPTYDCYDSDDEMRSDSTKRPSWAKSVNKEATLRTMSYIDLRIQNTLFNMKPQSPDLIEILGYISPRKLRRNSSVLWTHEPRFTLMLPGFEEDM